MKYATILVLLTLLAGSAEARNMAERRKFQRLHPCPSTHGTVGACPKYVVNHKQPLCLKGADKAENMEWQERRASYVSDARERRECRAAKAERARAPNAS